MAKGDKKNPLIDDAKRCAICNTNLTLYPKDFASCPHCQHSVCRQCWAGVWPTKAFTAEACAHMSENDGMAMSPMTDKSRNLQLDWHKAIFITVLTLLAAGSIWYLFYLFV